MIYGDLSISDRHRIEDRTAFFVNWCGVVAQDELNAWESGISSRVLHKVLANVVIDWHFLAPEYSLHGVGELVWAPNRFGGLGEIVPATAHPNTELAFGFFPTLVDVFRWGHFRKYGFKGIDSKDGKRFFKFADDIPYKMRLKSAVAQHEWEHWRALVKIYALMKGDERDALASCRTRTFAYHSLIFQLAHWRHDIRLVFDRIATGRMKDTDALFGDAATSFAQFQKKSSYLAEVERYRSVARLRAKHSEFSAVVPTCPDEERFRQKLAVIGDWTETFSHVHAVCQIAYAAIMGRPVATEALADIHLKQLVSSGLKISSVETTRWLGLLSGIPLHQRDIAQQCLALIDRFMRELQKRIGEEIPGLATFYRELLGDRYPLPRTSFKTGY